MIDFPTGFALQDAIGSDEAAHLHPKCSAVQTNGCVLCDCGAIAVEWARNGAEDWRQYVPDECMAAAEAALSDD